MLRIAATVCLLFSMTLVVCPQGRSGNWLKGKWEGKGFQIDTDETWTMRLRTQGRKFLVEYPSLNCGGEWKLISINSRRAMFRERITLGLNECVDKGNVLIERLNGRQIAYRYSYRGTTEVSASAILNRKR
ncbi:MAG: hypothetical protein H0W99_17790 [Acidobacteria bacterium]|jgi:hypothetical protein|nr:hypothetical protein [Acidobacteriota bacterium]